MGRSGDINHYVLSGAVVVFLLCAVLVYCTCMWVKRKGTVSKPRVEMAEKQRSSSFCLQDIIPPEDLAPDRTSLAPPLPISRGPPINSVKDAKSSMEALNFVEQQIESLINFCHGDAADHHNEFLSKYELPLQLHLQSRRGGQAYVIFAVRRGRNGGTPVAIKFFIRQTDFDHEVNMHRLQAVQRVCVPVEDIAEFGSWQDGEGRPLPSALVTEAGQSLSDRVRRIDSDASGTPSHKAFVFGVMCDLFDAVEHLHQAKLVHRDLKPSNIVFHQSANKWKLIDFGSAAFQDSEMPPSFSWAFAAPEVLQAYLSGSRHVIVQPSTDVWALGIIAFELLTLTHVHGEHAVPYEIFTKLRVPALLPWQLNVNDPHRFRMTQVKLGQLLSVIEGMLCIRPRIRLDVSSAYRQFLRLSPHASQPSVTQHGSMENQFIGPAKAKSASDPRVPSSLAAPVPASPTVDGPVLAPRDDSLEALVDFIHDLAARTGGRFGKGPYMIDGDQPIRKCLYSVQCTCKTTVGKSVDALFFAARSDYDRQKMICRKRPLQEFRADVREAIDAATYRDTSPRGGITVSVPNLIITEAALSMDDLIATMATVQKNSTIAAIATQLTTQLVMLHSKKIVHCGVTRRNIVHLSGMNATWTFREYCCYVGDGKEMDSARHQEIRILPPEAAESAMRQGPMIATAAMDIWQLGVLLFELYSGSPYWPLEYSADEVLRDLSTRGSLPHEKDPSLLNAVAAGVPALQPQKAIIASMLDRNPAKRPNAVALKRDLSSASDVTMQGNTVTSWAPSVINIGAAGK